MDLGKKVQARKLKGFQDYHPEIQKIRLHIMNLVRTHAEKAGFQPIATPALEYSEVLLGVGGETDKQIFRFKDNGKRDIALRFDLTVPFARYVAEHHGKMSFPFKRLQIGDVWRAEKPQKGRYREFSQCDLDIIGVHSDEADLEILLCFQNILNSINCGSFTMRIGHRQILSALIKASLGDLDTPGENNLLICLDKTDKIGPEKVAKILTNEQGLPEEGTKRLIAVLNNKGQEGTRTDQIYEMLAEDADALQRLEELTELINLVQKLGKRGRGNITLDLSIARGLGYYSGMVFETSLDLLPGWGSVCSGGRYNRLVERYLNREIPGVGGSLGLDRLVAALQETHQPRLRIFEKIIFVAISDPRFREYSFTLVSQLRSAGIAADPALKINKLGAQFRHANKMKYPLVLTVGEHEVISNTVSIKHMESGTEYKEIPRGSVTSFISEKFPSVLP